MYRSKLPSHIPQLTDCGGKGTFQSDLSSTYKWGVFSILLFKFRSPPTLSEGALKFSQPFKQPPTEISKKTTQC